MRRRLRILLALVGTVVIGTLTMPIFRPEDRVTVAQLRDGGMLACNEMDMLCDIRLPDDMVARLSDAGRGNGKRYQRVALDVRRCGDAGVIITDRRMFRDGGWIPGLDIVDGTCTTIADAGVADDALVRTVPQNCACRMATGLCRYTLPDAGLAQLPFGTTGSPPSLVVGPGCLRKSCISLAAGKDGTGKIVDESWPAACPGG